jgi:benzoyl-CoA 2,3-dioxygenase component A
MTTLRQHVTDPQLCIQCSACEMACPVKAIESILGRYCIDHNRCNDCKKCIAECPTGATDCFIDVEKFYTVSEQAEWKELPGK